MFFYLDVHKSSKYQICRCKQNVSGGRGRYGRGLSHPNLPLEFYDPAFTAKIGQNACFAKIGPTRKRR